MSRKVIIGIGISALAAGVFLWNTPVSFFDVLARPIQILMGSSHQLQTGVLEVSENIGPVREATRRLFKPLGVVRLISRFPTSTPPADSPSSSTSPHSQP